MEERDSRTMCLQGHQYVQMKSDSWLAPAWSGAPVTSAARPREPYESRNCATEFFNSQNLA